MVALVDYADTDTTALDYADTYTHNGKYAFTSHQELK